jgi:hypothetical protein
MKSSQRITRVQLSIRQQEEVILLGIVSTDPDYKLSLALNKKFHISLKTVLPVKIVCNNGNELTFSRFSDINDSPDIIYNLISNRSGKNHFLKKLKNVDYIFQIQRPEIESNISLITASLREIESINAVFAIDLRTLKDKNLQYLIQ